MLSVLKKKIVVPLTVLWFMIGIFSQSWRDFLPVSTSGVCFWIISSAKWQTPGVINWPKLKQL